MSYTLDYPIAAQASESARAAFIRRTYAHLAGAILAFVGIEYALFQIPGIERIAMAIHYAWIGVVIAMMAAGWVARSWARSESSVAVQYAGLGLYVLIWAVLFLPLLCIAQAIAIERYGDASHFIAQAGIMTLAIFAGLTVAVFLTRSDFSYLYPILSCAGFLALGLIVCNLFFPILGTWFSFAMVALACGYILYSTSNVMLHYRTDQHVGAALELFAAVALLFWYVLQIFMSRRN